MNTLRTHRGFTLIETLVALTILTLSVTGAFVAVQNGLSANTLSQDDVTAFYLAGGAIEQIRNIRDQNNLSRTPWMNGITDLSSQQDNSGPCAVGTFCTIDSLSATSAFLVQCPTPTDANSCPVLLQDQSQDANRGLYGYNSAWTPSRFTRIIQITNWSPDKDHEVAVKVTVSWKRGLLNRSFVVQENLLNWL